MSKTKRKKANLLDRIYRDLIMRPYQTDQFGQFDMSADEILIKNTVKIILSQWIKDNVKDNEEANTLLGDL